MKKIVGFFIAFALLITLLPLQKTEAATVNKHYTVNVAKLDVREKPSPKAKIVGSLKKGAVVFVYRTESGGWSRIKYKGKAGFVASSGFKNQSTSSVKINNSQLIANLNALTIKYKGETIPLEGWRVEEDNGLSANLTYISISTLKKLDSLHARGGDQAVREWGLKVIKEVDKAASSRGLTRGFIIAEGSCQAYEPKNFPKEDVLGYTGSCGYSFPIMYASKGDKTPGIFYED